MATKERIKAIEKRARAGGRGLILVRKAGRKIKNMAGEPISSADLADIRAAGGLILILDESLNGL